MSNIIEQIHHEIKTAYLEAVSDFNNNDHEVKDHYLKLKDFGFAHKKFTEESEKSEEKKLQSKIYTFIKQMKVDYPYKKFIPYDKLFEIISKYGLVIDIPENFVGNIPEKNIKDIAEFEFKDNYISHILGEYLFKPSSLYNFFVKYHFDKDLRKFKPKSPSPLGRG